jgi:hypothetical protein
MFLTIFTAKYTESTQSPFRLNLPDYWVKHHHPPILTHLILM